MGDILQTVEVANLPWLLTMPGADSPSCQTHQYSTLPEEGGIWRVGQVVKEGEFNKYPRVSKEYPEACNTKKGGRGREREGGGREREDMEGGQRMCGV